MEDAVDKVGLENLTRIEIMLNLMRTNCDNEMSERFYCAKEILQLKTLIKTFAEALHKVMSRAERNKKMSWIYDPENT